VRRGALDLIQTFAQLRLDVLQPERFVDLGFVSAAMILRPRRKPSGERVIPLSAARRCKISRCFLDPVANSRLTPKRRASVK
jgi:hypothetical protein